MPRVLCINPTRRDNREIQHLHNHIPFSCLYHSITDYTRSYHIQSTHIPLTHKIDTILHEISDLHLDGVFATDDYPGHIVSSVIAYEMGLPGPDPHIILPLQDKYYTRKVEHHVVPEATPQFEIISCNNPDIKHVSFPCIVKPIKGVGSCGTMYIRNHAELKKLSDTCQSHLQPLHDLLTRYSSYHMHTDSFLVEEYVPGTQVTVDGFVQNGAITIIGIVDCHVDPHTLQFERFIYPSRLPDHIQQRMHDIVTTLVHACHLDHTFFNVELRYDSTTDRITIIEMNTRMSSQFADMYEKVDGFHPYRTAIDIACGNTPNTTHRNGAYTQAHGFCMHADTDYFVESVPTPDEKNTLLREIPDMRVEVKIEPGQRMSTCYHAVFIYGHTLLNIGGDSDEELEKKFDYARQHLHFTFFP